MSRIHDELRSGGPNDVGWFIKVNDDLTYGPLTLSALYDQAARGDISPAKEISTDRRHWVPAQTIPELEMDWLVHRRSGETLGPFNLRALPHLVARGVVESSATARHTRNGSVLSVQTLLDAGPRQDPNPRTPAGPAQPQQEPPRTEAGAGSEEQILKLKDAAQAATTELAQARRKLDEQTRAFEARQAEHRQSEGALLDKIKALERAAAEHRGEKARHAEAESRRRQEQKDLKKETTEQRRKAAGATRRAETQKAKAAELRETCRSLKTKAQAGESAARRREEQLRKELDGALARRARLEEQLAENARHVEAAKARERELSKRVMHLEENLDSSTALLDTAREEIAKRAAAGAPLSRQQEESFALRVDRLWHQAAECADKIRSLQEKTSRTAASYSRKESDHLKRQLDLAKRIARLRKEADASSRALAEADSRLVATEKDFERLLGENEEREGELRQLLAGLNTAIETATDAAASMRGELNSTLQAGATVGRTMRQSKAERQPGAGDSDWYLALDRDTVFGPVSLGRLCEWAADCRIGPDHRVSRDKQDWRRAKDVPELRMEWTIELADGTRYGPLNAAAVAHLVGDGAADKDAEIVNAGTGKSIKASQLTAQKAARPKSGRRHGEGAQGAPRGSAARPHHRPRESFTPRP